MSLATPGSCLTETVDPSNAGAILHELHQAAQPLTVLQGLLELALLSSATAEEYRGVIKRAVEESTRTVVSPDRWKLCLRDKDLNELYNLNDDPLETRNLYADRQYASVISRLADEIHRWQESNHDKLKV